MNNVAEVNERNMANCSDGKAEYFGVLVQKAGKYSTYVIIADNQNSANNVLKYIKEKNPGVHELSNITHGLILTDFDWRKIGEKSFTYKLVTPKYVTKYGKEKLVYETEFVKVEIVNPDLPVYCK